MVFDSQTPLAAPFEKARPPVADLVSDTTALLALGKAIEAPDLRAVLAVA